MKLFLILLFSSSVCFASAKNSSVIKAQQNSVSKSDVVSFNFGQFLTYYSLSKTVMADENTGSFMPFHFTYQYLKDSQKNEFEVIYRRDNFSTFTNYQEFLFLYGLRNPLSTLDGVEWSLKFGAGYAAGNLAVNAVDRDGNLYFEDGDRYSCFQGASKVDLQKSHKIDENFKVDYGFGVLGILPVACKNEIPFSVLGVLVHRINPVLEAKISYLF